MNDILSGKTITVRYGKFIPYIVLAVLLFLSVLAWRHYESMSMEKDQRRYEEYVDAAVKEITERLDKYNMILRGVAGVFAASEEVTREEWGAYYEHQQVGILYPGVQGIGFSRVVRPPELERHIQEIRAEGYPDYAVHPAGEREVYTPLIFLEPFDERNQSAFGYDMFSEPVRRSAMERARDTGSIVISGKVGWMLDENEAGRLCFLMYMPVYANGLPLKNVEERRAAIRGYLGALFRSHDFMQGIFPDLDHKINFRLYDGAAVSPEALMYGTYDPDGRSRPIFRSQKTLDLHGCQWTMAFASLPAFDAAMDRYTPKLILAAGLVISLLIFFLFKTLELTGARAHALAREMTSALGESERMLRKSQEAAGIGSYTVDLIEDACKASIVLNDILGIPREDKHPMAVWSDIIHPEWREKVMRVHEDAVKNISRFDEEYIIIRKSDGTQRWVHDVGTVEVDGQGRPATLIGTIEDITKRKQAEQEKESLRTQLFQAQKMESVGRLAGGVAHDYNNMLSVILGYTEMAMEQVDPAGPLHADLTEVYKAGQRSMDITGQLLAFARKQVINPQVIDLNEAMEGMLKMLRRLIGENIDFAFQPGARLWRVHMDPMQIDQILANLCVNARDAIVGVGKITIETKNIAIDERYCADHAGFVPGDFVMMVVSDNGCGMDGETLGNIFEPFFTTKEAGKGTGLGLATVYGIVKQNNGFINVYSEPGKGTTFRVYLPRHADEAEGTVLEAAAEIIPGRGETVLLVEDEAVIIRMGKMMLERLGYHVIAAETPADALRLASEHAGTIHLLLTDVVMPEMNGRDLADQIKNFCPDIRVLYMSGYTANAIAHHGMLDRGVRFIGKPFSQKDLAAKIRAALE